jgi:hypothetical protein
MQNSFIGEVLMKWRDSHDFRLHRLLIIADWLALLGFIPLKLSLIKEEKNNTNRYVLSRFSHLYLRNARQVELEVEWFNGTLFEIEFGITSGVVKINNLECKVSSVEKRTCSHSSFCNYTVSIPDSEIVQIIQDSALHSLLNHVDLSVVLNTEAKVTYEYDGKPESTRTIPVTCSFEHKTIIPEKI